MQKEILNKLTNIENLLSSKTEKPLNLDEAADYLGVSKSHLYKLTCKNKIPFYRPTGKRCYFEKSELHQWLLRNPVKTNSDIDRQANDYIVNGRGEQ